MTAISLRAHFDGQQLILDEPCSLPSNIPLVVTIQSADAVEEREQWARLAASALSHAYSEDEPEYSIADIKHE